jgi:hypothetical protein
MTFQGERGMLWHGRDPTNRVSKMNRDVLLRLAKAGFTAHEVSDDELRANAPANAHPSGAATPEDFSKWGPWRRIFVVGSDTAGDALDRAMGKGYRKMPSPVTFHGERGRLWFGADPIDPGSEMDRDVLLRLAKAEFTAREVSDDELRENARANAHPSGPPVTDESQAP